MAGRHTFTIDQGATWRRWIVLWQDRAKTARMPLAGFTARMQFRRTPDDPEAAATLTTENGKISIDTVNSKISWVLSAVETAQLAGEYHYELEILNSLGEPYSILKGLIKVSPEVVR